MTIHLGNVPANSTLYIPFASYNSSGASVTISGLAVTDIEIYKNGSVTQRSSDAGYTLLDTDGIDFDGITGIHGFSIDLSDNTDAGFFSVGGFYWVVVSSVTADAQTVNFIAATFRIVTAEGVTGQPKVDVAAFGGTAGTFSGGRPEVNTSHAAGTAWNSGAIGAATLASDTITAAKIAADAITAAKIATGAIDADALAADAAGEIADAVWDEDATGHQTQGTFGQAIGDPVADSDTIWGLVNTNLNATVGSRATQTSVDTIDDFLDTEVAAIKAKTDQLTFSIANRVDSQVFGIENNAITAASIATGAIDADAIADNAIDAGAIAADAITAAKIADGAIDAATFAAGAITASAIAADAIGASELAADAVTEIQNGLATQASVDTIDNFLDTEIAAILALLDDPRSEPGQGNPPVNPDLATKIDYLYKAWRNKKTQTADTWSLFADDGTTVDQKSTVSDNGTTATRGEVVTGA